MLIKRLSGSGSLYKRNGYWYIHFTMDGKQRKKSLGKCSRDEARERADKLIIETFHGQHSTSAANDARIWDYELSTLRRDKDNWAGRLYAGARSRAIKYGFPCEISYNDVVDMAFRSHGRCELTGIPFSWEPIQGKRTTPYRPSLDRKNCAEGYTLENTRLVCYCVNAAMNEWGESVIHRIASAPYLKAA